MQKWLLQRVGLWCRRDRWEGGDVWPGVSKIEPGLVKLREDDMMNKHARQAVRGAQGSLARTHTANNEVTKPGDIAL